MTFDYKNNSTDLSSNPVKPLNVDTIIGSGQSANLSANNSNPLNINSYFLGKSNFPSSQTAVAQTEPSINQSNPPFTSGWFTVGSNGSVSFDFLVDDGAYQGELAIFNLEGMGQYELGSSAFIKEAAKRVLSNSSLGYIVISDILEGARWSGTLDSDAGHNSGEYKGSKTFTMRAGDQFGLMLAPNGTIQQVFDNADTESYIRPLFSIAEDNPFKASHVSLLRSMEKSANIFAIEDLQQDGTSDNDFNDFVFYMSGASGAAPSFETLVNPVLDWHKSNIGKQVMEWKPTLSGDDDQIIPPPILPPYKEGDLVKGSDAKVYLIESGNKRWIPNPGIQRQNNLEAKPITVLSDEELSKISLSDQLPIPLKYKESPNASDKWYSEFYWWDGNGTPLLNFSENKNNQFAALNLPSNISTDGKKGIVFNWGTSSPNGDDKLLNDNFAIRSYTQVNFEPGKTYMAKIKADDGYQLFARNQSTGELRYFTSETEWKKDAYDTAKEVKLDVSKPGTYDLYFQYFENGGDAKFDLSLQERTIDKVDRLLQLANKSSSLTVTEIQEYRKLVIQKPESERAEWYRKLQYKTLYFNQRDNGYSDIADLMCNVTTLASCLTSLGVKNPNPNRQFEDALEDILRSDQERYPGTIINNAREWWNNLSKLAVDLGVVSSGLKKVPGFEDSNVEFFKNYVRDNWEQPLSQGKGLMLGVWTTKPGHIVKLIDIDWQRGGLVVDDPFGKAQDSSGSDYQKNGYIGTGNTRNRGSIDTQQGQDEQGIGNDNFWSWSYCAEVFGESWYLIFSESNLSGGGGDNSAIEYGSYQPKVSQDFLKKLAEISQRLKVVPEYLMAAMGFETGGSYSPSVKNPYSGATGLIQFMPSTAKSLGTSTEALSKMTALEQLDYVEKYFQPHTDRLKTLEDVYMSILWPVAIGKGSEYILFKQGTIEYKQNAGLDIDKNGDVTAQEATRLVREFLPKKGFFA